MENYRFVGAKKIKYLLNTFLLSILFVCLSSCITNSSLTLLQEGDSLPHYENASYEYYTIKKNDELIIQVISINQEVVGVFTSGENSTTSYRVYKDGTIDIPFISGIHIEGLTIREAAHKIQDSVRSFAPDATVKVGLANDYFYVLGNNGGRFPLYKEKLSIFQAIAFAGHFAPNGDRKKVRIVRAVPSQESPVIMEFDLRSKSLIDSEFYYIQPNDIIYVSSIKGDFFKVSSYSSTIGSITSSLSFFLLILGLF